MYARSKSSLVLAAAFALSALSLTAGTTGCAVEEARDRGEEAGRIAMPLISLAEDGTIYRLDDISLETRETTGQLDAVMYPSEATGALAQYRFGQLPLSLFFSGSFSAADQEGQPALSLLSYTTAIELCDDAFGVMSEEVAPRLSGYTLRLDVVSKPDGTQEIEGSFTHNFIPYEPMLTFGPAALSQRLPLSEQGYPMEGAMAASMPFALELNDADGSMMSGQLNVQYAPNGS